MCLVIVETHYGWRDLNKDLTDRVEMENSLVHCCICRRSLSDVTLERSEGSFMETAVTEDIPDAVDSLVCDRRLNIHCFQETRTHMHISTDMPTVTH